MDIDPQAIILLVFMVIAFLKFVGENLKAKNQQEEEPGDIEELYERTREEILDRQRSASPPSGETSPAGRKAPEQLSILDFFTPVSQPQPEPSLPSTPPPLPDEATAPPLPEPVTSPTPKPSLSTAEAAALERIRQAENQPARSRRTIRRRPIRELLTSPAAARDAIILGEILGTPRGQQRSSGLTSLENR